MKALPAPLRQKLLTEPSRPFSVVVAFDSITALSQAKQLCSHLLDQLNHDVDLQCSWCRFDQLPDEHFAREAVEVAAAADLIVVAAAQPGDPAPGFSTWLEKAFADRTHREGALAALIGSPAGCPASPSRLYGYLQALADRSGRAFFASSFAAPCSASPLTHLEERAAALTPCLQGILDRPIGIPRWGINE